MFDGAIPPPVTSLSGRPIAAVTWLTFGIGMAEKHSVWFDPTEWPQRRVLE
jgi:hypothetical protein